MKIITLFLAAGLVIGCAHEPRSADHAKKWTAEDLVGYEYILVDTNRFGWTYEVEEDQVFVKKAQTFNLTNTCRIAEYRFASTGYGSAMFGLLNGPIAAPGIKWEIERTGVLVIEVGSDIARWILSEKNGDRFVVTTDRGRETFVRQKN